MAALPSGSPRVPITSTLVKSLRKDVFDSLTAPCHGANDPPLEIVLGKHCPPKVCHTHAMNDDAGTNDASATDLAGTPTMVVAHRGASADHPENTIAAFVGAREQGADGIELDVRLSADDVLVLHHDAHLADGRMVREVQSSDLPTSVPSLAEALEATDPLFTNIELKNLRSDPDFDAAEGLSIAVAGLITAFEAHDRVLVSSFDIEAVLRIRATDPTVPIGWLVWGQADPVQLIARVEAHGMQAIHPHDLLVDSAFVRRAHDAGVQVNVWTVDDLDRGRALVEMGVDAIITNTPALMIEAIRQG